MSAKYDTRDQQGIDATAQSDGQRLVNETSEPFSRAGPASIVSSAPLDGLIFP